MKKFLLTFITLAFSFSQQNIFADSQAASQSTPTVKSKANAKKNSKTTHKKTSKVSSQKTIKKSSKKSTKKNSKVKTSPPPAETAAIPPPPGSNVVASSPQPAQATGPTPTQLYAAYKYAYALYSNQRFDKAKDIFKKISLISRQPSLNANSLYYYSQCCFRTEDYGGCVKGLTVLAKKWPSSPAITKGYVSRFSVFLIDQVTKLRSNWDYYRYTNEKGENGDPVWKESIPPGPKLKRINFKLGFGLYRVLRIVQPNSPETYAAKQKLDAMLAKPITIVWADEKAPKDKFGHPSDFFSVFSVGEKKHFSNVICERMFFDWQCEKFYRFLNMYDDVRNLKPRFTAKTFQQADSEPVTVATASSTMTASGGDQEIIPILTLSRLFEVAGYDPFNDGYANVIEQAPIDSL